MTNVDIIQKNIRFKYISFHQQLSQLSIKSDNTNELSTHLVYISEVSQEALVTFSSSNLQQIHLLFNIGSLSDSICVCLTFLWFVTGGNGREGFAQLRYSLDISYINCQVTVHIPHNIGSPVFTDTYKNQVPWKSLNSFIESYNF